MGKIADAMEALMESGLSGAELLSAVRSLEDRMTENQREQIRGERWRVSRLAAIQRDGDVCTYCGCTDGEFVVDHVIPTSRGGTHDLDNLAVACRSCNASKKDRLVEEWGGKQ